MLTLNRLYSDTQLFDEVSFHPGINIVLGRYSGPEGSVNGIGKSTLVRLLDFAFLASRADVLSPEKHPFLKEHNVVLEFNLDQSDFQIKRSFGDLRVAHFGRKGETLVDYTVQELTDILGNLVFMPAIYPEGYVSNRWFRTLMRFFIKDDIHRRRQDQPTNFVDPSTRESQLLYYNFFLAGLPNRNLYEFDLKQQEMRERQAERRELEKRLRAATGMPISELKREALKVRDRIARLEASLQEFEFIQNYKDAESELERLSQAISDRLNDFHAYRTILKRYQDSYDVDIEVDIHKVIRLYQEVSHHLGEFVQRTLEEVIEFRRQIADNRRRFLADKEAEVKTAIDDVLREITQLEGRRQKLYGLLQEVGAFDSLRHTYEQLIEEKVGLERDNSVLNRLSEIESSLADLKAETAKLARAILSDIQQSQQSIDDLVLLFDEILENAVLVDPSSRGGYLDIKPTPNQAPPAKIVVEVPKSDSLGKFVLGILAYDLTIFLNIVRNRRKLPHFLIHDGVFHGIDRRTVVKVLNYVYRQSLANPGFQYIITGNEDEIFVSPSYGKYEFDVERSTVAIYEDDPAKMIFKHEFQ